jgi:hypothetical protein
MGFEPTTPTLARLYSMLGRLRPRSKPSRDVGLLSIGEKLEISPKPQSKCTTNILKSLALPRGLEPLFSP